MTKLRQVRHQRQLSQDELAKRSGLTRVAINRIERGKVSPTLVTLYRIAAAMNVHPATLLDDPTTNDD